MPTAEGPELLQGAKQNIRLGPFTNVFVYVITIRVCFFACVQPVFVQDVGIMVSYYCYVHVHTV